MANLLSTTKVPYLPTDHPPIQGIDQMSASQLESHGYYRGFPCPHNHTIREATQHWCYHCAQKIRSNICGFDLNYLDAKYKHKYAAVWKQIPIGDLEECWESPAMTRSRHYVPSYRNHYSKEYSNNVTAHKLIYQCAWGDVGAMKVTRSCGNKSCLNPLHLVSSWNRVFAPGTIHPFTTEFEYNKLMQYNQMLLKGDPAVLVERQYKQTIQHPLIHKNTPDYDNGYA